METEKTELGKRSYKSGNLGTEVLLFVFVKSKQKQQIGNRNYRRKRYFTFGMFWNTRLLRERERDRERQYGNLSFLGVGMLAGLGNAWNGR